MTGEIYLNADPKLTDPWTFMINGALTTAASSKMFFVKDDGAVMDEGDAIYAALVVSCQSDLGGHWRHHYG